ncbi:MAG: BLUF domain-containing protein [Pseudomonadota bacterium]
MTLYRACYTSRTILSDGETIDALATHIAQHAALHNSAIGLSGVLLYSPTHFVQVVEGERSLINRLLWKLGKDPRHEAMELIEFAPVGRRLFGTTPMRLCRAEIGVAALLDEAADANETPAGGLSPDALIDLAQQVIAAEPT